MDELFAYVAVLKGEVEPPVDNGITTLMEVANAYLTRALEVSMQIKAAEQRGQVLPKTGLYKFRTGVLRDFIEMASKCQDMGSRRLTAYQMELEHRDVET